MTIPDPQPPDVGNPIPTMPLPPGCTTCGTQLTVTLDGRFGRRCEQHPPGFDPRHAVELMTKDPGAAIDYVRGVA